MDDSDRFDFVGPIVGKPVVHDRGIDAVAPVTWNKINLESETDRHVAPQRRKMTGLEHQHVVAGRQRVDERRLPRARAGRGINDDAAGGLKHALKSFEHFAAQSSEHLAAVIDCGLRQRAQNTIWDVRRSRNLEKMPAAIHGGS